MFFCFYLLSNWLEEIVNTYECDHSSSAKMITCLSINTSLIKSETESNADIPKTAKEQDGFCWQFLRKGVDFPLCKMD